MATEFKFVFLTRAADEATHKSHIIMGKNSSANSAKRKNETSNEVQNTPVNTTQVNDAQISQPVATSPEGTTDSGTENTNVPATTTAQGTESGAIIPATTTNNKKLTVAFSENVKTVEFNSIVSETVEDKEQAVKQYVRNKLLRQFNVVEVQKNMVSGGKLYLNGNRTALKLPPVKEKANGEWAETLQQYTERVLPDINKWIARSVQTSNITMEIIGSLC